MKIHSFRKSQGQKVTHYNSNFILSKIVKTEAMAQIGCFYLEAGDVVGAHEAAVPQMLLVVSGKGCVQGHESKDVLIEAGDAVFWSKGERHKTYTDTGMTAIVIESPEMAPSHYMSLKG
ncbi:cupin domain-containing protein [Salinicoccus sesuvii]|uniref:Cupin domain-containing protein n=1 Tax=Salinicoccus sesuvii TaxID=868281 RepID=A0ABV7N2R9_9STAP